MFVCHHLTLGLRVGLVGQGFFHFGESQSRSQGCNAFIQAWSKEKEPLSPTTVIIDSDKALVNQRNEEIRSN